MATPDFKRTTQSAFTERLNHVNQETERQWGTMDALSMIRHLRATFELSLGEIPDVRNRSVPILRTLIRILFFEWFTNWPKGKIKGPPEAFPLPDNNFEEERRLLADIMERFLDECERNPNRKTLNPILGPLSLKYWSHVHGLHCHHHFCQFGSE